ncbi:MAG: hypothetical protein IPM23_16900 [Candidatus Melainabacteria bacterium]|nr:hypothetical protein [Candidatus Melainabacteria bacterium]
MKQAEKEKLSREILLTYIGVAVVVLILVINFALVFYVTDRMTKLEERSNAIDIRGRDLEPVPIPDLTK